MPTRPRTLPRPAEFALLGLLALILGYVLWTGLRCPMKDDLAWLVYVARQWLSGERLYTDLVEVNPPLIIWITAVPTRLAEWLGIDPKFAVLPLVCLAILGLSWWTAALLRPLGGVLRHRAGSFAALAAVLLAVPGIELGQREHLMLAALLPYVAVFARALERRPVPWGMALLAGLVGGAGVALKPQYAVVLGLLELLGLWRGLRPWRVAPLAAGSAIAGYVAALVLVYPAFLKAAVPLAVALYGGTDSGLSDLLHDCLGIFCGQAVLLAAWLLTRRHHRADGLLQALALLSAGFVGVCLFDGKNWFYHRLPAIIAIVLALLYWAAGFLTAPRPAGRAARRRPDPAALAPALAAAALFVFGIATVQRLAARAAEAADPGRGTQARLEMLIRREHAHSYVAFSEWIGLGFPVVTDTGVRWTSRFDSMWAVRGELWRRARDGRAPADWPIRRWVVRDFLRGCPDLVLVDERTGLDYPAVLGAADPAFLRAWRHYRPIAAFDGLRVYRRGTPAQFAPRAICGPASPEPRLMTAAPEAAPPRPRS